ncbi:hypothetical protein [Clostridium botulinum]|uniref:hypothetical protein n=1 Tax=Clostridium botulinum TaxID=1491 RepID=UPI0021BE3ADA|nr:hypothetical protein [Clostridium botulinum]
MYKLNMEQMTIDNIDKNQIVCLVDTKRPDLFEKKVNEMLDKANKYERAIELLKEFAFYDIEGSIKEHCDRALEVQNFLRDSTEKEWLFDMLKKHGDKELEWKSEMTEWGEIYCPFLGRDVMTYYPTGMRPYDTITNPFVDEDGGVYYYKYDHDEGGWREDIFSVCEADEYENIEGVLFY